MLHCVALCCSALQCAAVCCSVSQTQCATKFSMRNRYRADLPKKFNSVLQKCLTLLNSLLSDDVAAPFANGPSPPPPFPTLFFLGGRFRWFFETIFEFAEIVAVFFATPPPPREGESVCVCTRVHIYTSRSLYTCILHLYIYVHVYICMYMHAVSLFQGTFCRACALVGSSSQQIGLYRSLLQIIVSFTGLFCKRDLLFQGSYSS